MTSSHTAIDPREKDLSIPKHARAAFSYKDHGPIELKQDHPVVQPDELERGQVLVRMLFSGVCHTDLHALHGDWPVPKKLPLCGGHEGAGVVVALGPGSDEFVAVGDRVGVKWIADACLHCAPCRMGDECSCQKVRRLSGYTVDGTFAQYVVSWARYVTPIPKELPLADAAPILCAGLTVYKSLKQANLSAGESVVVLGSGGGLGHLCCQYAAAAGLRVIAIDTGEEKRDFSLKCGAETFLDFRTLSPTELSAAVRGASPDQLGAHAAIVAASSAAAYEQALSYLRPHGTLVALGLPANAKMSVDVLSTVIRQLTIKGSYVGNRQEAIEALDMAARGKVKVSYHLRGLTELSEVFEQMEKGQLVGRIVLDLDK
ncbi:alcohol dehydrogenase [Tilletia horrida]|nr:alcohol dehydrogenase [Tilletia horrida]